MGNKILIGWFIIFLLINPLLLKGQKTSEEFVKEEYLKTVTLYSYSAQDNFQKRYLNPAVVNLANPGQQLVFEFDDMRAQFSEYKIRIIHCELDGTPSRLLEMEYLSQINELFLNDFRVSQNTKVPYYHYRVIVPKPSISGNFILQLYENDEIVIQRKFWVYDNQIDIVANAQAAHDPEFWKTSQQLNLKLDLKSYRVGIPQRELKVFIRMNQDLWKEVNNANLTNTGQNTFTLQQFNNDYLFPAGNEYRYLDITSSFRRGQNVKTIDLGRPDVIYTYHQVKRSTLNFTDSYDTDGGYVISNLDGNDADISSEYVNVVFELTPYPIDDNEQPVLYGKLTNWDYLPLDFNPSSGMLEHSILLKNGVYDFAFGLQNMDTKRVDRAFYEGDFNQTGNTYEIFVYHTIPGRRYVNLVGYQMTSTFKP